MSTNLLKIFLKQWQVYHLCVFMTFNRQQQEDFSN